MYFSSTEPLSTATPLVMINLGLLMSFDTALNIL